jgi:hypothetical protein
MSPIIQGHSSPNAGSDLREVESDAVLSSHSVIGHALDAAEVHADSSGVVEDDISDRRHRESADEAGLRSHASQGVGHIVFSAAYVDFEGSGKLDSTGTGRGKTHHALSQRDQIQVCIHGPTLLPATALSSRIAVRTS